MKATVLVDNTAKEPLEGEWGLSVYIEYEGRKILLDTAKTDMFASNAKKLGIDLSCVDYAVLSHAHYDHADGMETFFALNSRAKFYLRSGAGENCYSRNHLFRKYIGIRKGTLSRFSGRIEYVEGVFRLTDGVWLVPHTAEGLDAIGRKAKLYRRKGRRLVPDDFSHEQSLVFQTPKGLVIFSSCSHAGAGSITDEVSSAFPGEKIYAVIGGLHLFRSSDSEVEEYAECIARTGIDRIVTGHCTGARAFGILESRLGGRTEQMYSGYVFEV